MTMCAGKVVIDAFRLTDPRTQALGQEPRQTTSNLGHLQKPSIQVSGGGTSAFGGEGRGFVSGTRCVGGNSGYCLVHGENYVALLLGLQGLIGCSSIICKNIFVNCK